MEGTSQEEYYEVEKIVDKRVRDGKNEYLLKWAGWPASSNSWTREENVDCPELLATYENKSRRLAAVEERARHEPKVKPLFAPGEATGFDQGLEAEAITGVTKIGSQIIYFIRWKGEDQLGIIPGHVAEQRCPQLVIEYMENNLRRSDQHSK